MALQREVIYPRTQTKERDIHPHITTIADLPNELLQTICEDLDQTSLLSIAVLSKRISVIALGHYYLLIKFEPTTGLLAFGHPFPPFETIRGLRLGLITGLFPSLLAHQSLQLYFVGPPADCAKAILQSRRLVDLLSSINYLRLDFTGIEGCSIPNELKGIQDALADFLNSLRRGGGCRSLAVSGDISLGPPAIGAPALTAQCLTSLHDVTFFSPMFVSPSLRAWTLASLNNSPVCNLNLLSHLEFQSIFPKLSLQHLQALFVMCSTLEWTDLITFLDRHPWIVSLRRRDEFLPEPNTPPFPTSTLPNLTTLSGSPEFLSHVLASPKSLPALTSLEIDWEAEDLPTIPLHRTSALNQALTCLVPRQTVHSLDLRVHNGGAAMAQWLSVDDITTQPRQERCLPQITKLKLSLHALPGDAIIHSVPRWLGLFPNLREVHLSSWGAYEEQKDSDKVAYVRLVQDACPKVVVLRLDHVSKRVEQWLEA